MRTQVFALVVGLVLSAHALEAQDRSRYRDFRLGSDLPSVATLGGAAKRSTVGS